MVLIRAQPKKGWAAVVGLALAAIAAVGWQWHLNAELRIARYRATALHRSPPESSTERAPANEAELAASAAAEAESLRLAHAEVASLRQRLAAAAANSEPVDRFAIGRMAPAAEWRNVGTATAKAALETVLWAGAGGDVQAFAGMLQFFPQPAEDAARRLWEATPETMRARCRSPEELLAFLSIKDVPLGGAQLRKVEELEGWPWPAAQARVLLSTPEGKQKDVSLLFLNAGAGWKLLVTKEVVEKYARELAPPSPNAASDNHSPAP